ncbi:Crp/Fnr family transcriptional regulator [Oleiagrimonas sp. C23AA]|uniref:Crp/Fnr family transcriptional regulator n=1 Tax=Oleiagrimonas sp. C23AA TaxID=2719047 RepID=UPI001F0EC940|nr:Crp/Fnr family transcriptional regulator [Oleiagrimonas sp. C23AA]
MAQPLSEHTAHHGRLLQLAPGARLYRQGEACAHYFMVLEGWVVQSMVTRDGAVQILDFAVPGHVLGLASATGPMRHTAQCLTKVRVRAHASAQLPHMLGKDARIGHLLLQAACLNEARAHHRLVHLGLRDARQRVAQLLVDLYVRVTGHAPVRAGDSMVLPLTQRHIAQATGLSGEHVNRTLRRLREQGVLHFTKHRLHVLDPQALWAVAGHA